MAAVEAVAEAATPYVVVVPVVAVVEGAVVAVEPQAA